MIAPRLAAIEAILRGAEARGEVGAGGVTPLTARVGPALIVQHFLLTGRPPTRRDLSRIIDMLLPEDRGEAGGQVPRRRAGAR